MSNFQSRAYVITGEPYLIEPPVRLIQETKLQKTRILCIESFRCKRMECKTCRYIRRNYFINNGIWFSKQYQLDCHLFITWKLDLDYCPWKVLKKNFYCLNKRLSGKMGKFIRTLAIGTKANSPHVHFLINSGKAEYIKAKAYELKVNDVSFNSKPCFDPEGLLGYFFDQNYIPTFLNPERPKGMRIISGSRGMRYGFPPVNKG